MCKEWNEVVNSSNVIWMGFLKQYVQNYPTAQRANHKRESDSCYWFRDLNRQQNDPLLALKRGMEQLTVENVGSARHLYLEHCVECGLHSLNPYSLKELPICRLPHHAFMPLHSHVRVESVECMETTSSSIDLKERRNNTVDSSGVLLERQYVMNEDCTKFVLSGDVDLGTSKAKTLRSEKTSSEVQEIAVPQENLSENLKSGIKVYEKLKASAKKEKEKMRKERDKLYNEKRLFEKDQKEEKKTLHEERKVLRAKKKELESEAKHLELMHLAISMEMERRTEKSLEWDFERNHRMLLEQEVEELRLEKVVLLDCLKRMQESAIDNFAEQRLKEVNGRLVETQIILSKNLEKMRLREATLNVEVYKLKDELEQTQEALMIEAGRRRALRQEKMDLLKSQTNYECAEGSQLPEIVEKQRMEILRLKEELLQAQEDQEMIMYGSDNKQYISLDLYNKLLQSKDKYKRKVKELQEAKQESSHTHGITDSSESTTQTSARRSAARTPRLNLTLRKKDSSKTEFTESSESTNVSTQQQKTPRRNFGTLRMPFAKKPASATTTVKAKEEQDEFVSPFPGIRLHSEERKETSPLNNEWEKIMFNNLVREPKVTPISNWFF